MIRRLALSVLLVLARLRIEWAWRNRCCMCGDGCETALDPIVFGWSVPLCSSCFEEPRRLMHAVVFARARGR